MMIQHRTHKTYFDIRPTSHWWAAQQGMTHELMLMNGRWDDQGHHSRFCKPMKTVTHVAVDEDENGNAIIERWPTRLYP